MDEKTTPSVEDFEASLNDLFAEFEDSIGDEGDTDAEVPENNTSDGDDTAAEEEKTSEEPGADSATDSAETTEEPKAATESSDAAEEAPENPEVPAEEEAAKEEAEEPRAESAYERQEREDLAVITAANPGVKLKSLRDLGKREYAQFIGMRLAGFTAEEAYKSLASSASAAPTVDPVSESSAPTQPEKPVSKPASKAHLGSAAPKSFGAPEGMTREELSAARDLFPSLSEREIQSLYRRTTKH